MAYKMLLLVLCMGVYTLISCDNAAVNDLPLNNTPIDSLPIDSINIDTMDTTAGVFYYKAPLKPFPQHPSYAANVIIPSVAQLTMDEQVIAFYKKWKTRYLKAINDTQYYVHYTREFSVGNAISCSEGHGFGMVITALMAGVDSNSYDDFVKLYHFYDAHRSSMNPHLMAWQQDKNGKNSSGADSASDGDLDIAYALLLAHKQWGSDGNINFLQAADKIIEAIYQSDISEKYKTIELGDWVNGGKYGKSTRFCDFMLDHMRTFANYTGNQQWYEVIDTAYSIVNQVSHPETGLLPDFAIYSDSGFVACEPDFLEGPYDGNYYFNSCRAPWRLAMDIIVSGDTTAQTALKRLNHWLFISTQGDAHNISGGYYLDGTPLNNWSDMAFTAPFGVCAMVDVNNQEWLNEMWRQINAESISSGAYFGNSIKMICLITMSGNWWAPY